MQWIKNLQRDLITKKAVVISGNINDVYTCEKLNGSYVNLLEIIKSILSSNYEIITWDSIKWIEANSNTIKNFEVDISSNSKNNIGDDYDIDDDLDDNEQANDYKDAEQFFSLIYPQIKKNGNKAFIIDFTNYIFSNLNQMAENQKNGLQYFQNL